MSTSRTRFLAAGPAARLVLGLLCGVLARWPVGAQAQGHRVFERVTPAQKNNASAINAIVIDSDHTTLATSSSVFDTDPFLSAAGEYISARSPTGWTLEFSPLTPATSLVGFPAWNDRIFETFTPLLPGENDGLGIDVYRWTAGTLSLVSTGAVGGGGQFDADYLGSAQAGEHILFRTSEVLDPDDTGRDPFTTMLYERAGEQTRAVGLDSDEQPISADGAILAGAGAGALGPLGEGGITNPISADGSRIFFEAPDPARGGNTQLYVREDGQATTQVSAPQRSAPGSGPLPVRFQGASADGSRVLFRTAGQLVDDDDDEYIDLYAYDLATQELTRVSAGQQDPVAGRCQADGPSGAPGVCGVVAVSEDAQRVYYMSTGVLADGAVAGEVNVYLYDGHSGDTQFLLSTPSDFVSDIVDEEVRELYQKGFERTTTRAETTADGSVLVFAANSSLTGFDNASPACPSASLNRCTQIYRYDAATEDIACLSCNPTGAPPLGAAYVPLGGFTPGAVRYFLSSDGSVVAFETPDPLVPEDVNGRNDVYEWHDGKVSLISAGNSPRGAELVGIGPDGADIFLLTGAALVPDDTDTLTDLYDARIGGGFPEPSAPPGSCAEDSCQGPPSPAPKVELPTLAAPGDGDVVPKLRPRILTLRIAPPIRGQRRVRVRVHVNAPGTVSVAAAARITGRQRVFARASKQLGKARAARFTLALRRDARRALFSRKRLKVDVTARLSKATGAARSSITLRIRASR